MAKYCSKCGEHLAEGQQFCGSCGAPAEGAPKKPSLGRSCLGCFAMLLLVSLSISVLALLGSEVEEDTAVRPTAVSAETMTEAVDTERNPAATSVLRSDEEVVASTVTAKTAVRANFRSGPSTDFTPYLQIEPGEPLSLLSVHQANGETWYRARYDDLTGWINSTVLDIGDSVAAELPSFGDVVDAAATGDELVQSYLVVAAFNTALITEAMGNNGVLFSAPQLTNERWRSAVLSQQEVIQLAHRLMTEYEAVPAPMRSLHEQMLGMTSACNEMAIAIEKGIQTFDAATFEVATEHSQHCASRMEALAAQLEQSVKDE